VVLCSQPEIRLRFSALNPPAVDGVDGTESGRPLVQSRKQAVLEVVQVERSAPPQALPETRRQHRHRRATTEDRGPGRLRRRFLPAAAAAHLRSDRTAWSGHPQAQVAQEAPAASAAAASTMQEVAEVAITGIRLPLHSLEAQAEPGVAAGEPEMGWRPWPGPGIPAEAAVVDALRILAVEAKHHAMVQQVALASLSCVTAVRHVPREGR
jgi:hypothetical protein